MELRLTVRINQLLM